MAIVELTREQLCGAVRQLPERERIELIAELLSETNGFPQGDEARKLFKRLRGKYRMSPKDERRTSQLLAKGNEGTLTAKERRELDALLDESQERTLQLALAVMFSGKSLRSPSSKTSKRRGAG